MLTFLPWHSRHTALSVINPHVWQDYSSTITSFQRSHFSCTCKARAGGRPQLWAHSNKPQCLWVPLFQLLLSSTSQQSSSASFCSHVFLTHVGLGLCLRKGFEGVSCFPLPTSIWGVGRCMQGVQCVAALGPAAAAQSCKRCSYVLMEQKNVLFSKPSEVQSSVFTQRPHVWVYL